MSQASEATPVTLARVWDLPQRLFHWLLVLCLGGCWITGEAGIEAFAWHRRLGYLALGLVIFRVLWGFAGSRYARFASFVSGPRAVLAYARTLLQRAPSHWPGHNPAGGVSVLLMLLLVAVQAGSGLFADDEIFTSGPLRTLVSSATAKTLTSLHHLNFDLLLAVVALHVAAVFWYLLFKGENLIWPMVTGRKPVSQRTPSGQEISGAGMLWRVGGAVLFSAGTVALIVNLPVILG